MQKIKGIPFVLFIVDIVLCGKLENCSMSAFEFMANYILCCFCVGKKKIEDISFVKKKR
jgi:hypothetical protein